MGSFELFNKHKKNWYLVNAMKVVMKEGIIIGKDEEPPGIVMTITTSIVLNFFATCFIWLSSFDIRDFMAPQLKTSSCIALSHFSTTSNINPKF